MKKSTISTITRNNWFIALGLALAGFLASLSGLYFLFFTSGGYQGGRNPYYDVQILLDRSGWDLIHTWTGTAMIAIVVIHLILHWTWVMTMVKRSIKRLIGQGSPLNPRSRLNLILNLVVAVSFFLSAISGVYFLAFPNQHNANSPLILFTRTGWDLLHTWASVGFLMTAVVHIAIHWKWITKVTRRYFSKEKRVVKPVISREQPVLVQSETQI